jgi:hypothetical protein
MTSRFAEGSTVDDAAAAAARVIDEIALALDLSVSSHPGLPPHVSRPDTLAQELQLQATADADLGWVIHQKIWPADTVAQARTFFDRVDPDRFFGLAGMGWRIIPNLHFSFMSSQLIHATSAISAVDFYCLSKSGAESYGRHTTNPESLLPTVQAWVDRGINSEVDRDALRQKFLETRRQHINVIPGFQLLRTWSPREVATADAAEVSWCSDSSTRTAARY